MGAVFALFSAWYFWIPKILGLDYNRMLGKVHFWILFVGVNVTFFPQHFLGLQGMPRRISDYPDAFAGWNLISSYGSIISVIATWLFLYIVYVQLVEGKAASRYPWLTAEFYSDILQTLLNRNSNSLEWALNSPPKPHAFVSLPLQSFFFSPLYTSFSIFTLLNSFFLSLDTLLNSFFLSFYTLLNSFFPSFVLIRDYEGELEEVRRELEELTEERKIVDQENNDAGDYGPDGADEESADRLETIDRRIAELEEKEREIQEHINDEENSENSGSDGGENSGSNGGENPGSNTNGNPQTNGYVNHESDTNGNPESDTNGYPESGTNGYHSGWLDHLRNSLKQLLDMLNVH